MNWPGGKQLKQLKQSESATAIQLREIIEIECKSMNWSTKKDSTIVLQSSVDHSPERLEWKEGRSCTTRVTQSSQIEIISILLHNNSSFIYQLVEFPPDGWRQTHKPLGRRRIGRLLQRVREKWTGELNRGQSSCARVSDETKVYQISRLCPPPQRLHSRHQSSDTERTAHALLVRCSPVHRAVLASIRVCFVHSSASRGESLFIQLHSFASCADPCHPLRLSALDRESQLAE